MPAAPLPTMATFFRRPLSVDAAICLDTRLLVKCEIKKLYYRWLIPTSARPLPSMTT
jgi:hypothetical protein